MWIHPPQTNLTVNNVPGMDRYFARPLFLWMPRRLWKIQLFCPHSDCQGTESTESTSAGTELTSAGIYPRVRQVMDLTGWYSMAAEYLECKSCKRKVISWSNNIVSQLDIAHRVQFPCVMTYQLACDMKVVRMLRRRGMGNSSTQIQKKLAESHNEVWLEKVIHYLRDCDGFAKFTKRVGFRPSSGYHNHPPQKPVPSAKWLLSVYVSDVLQRIDEVKASITSTFGKFLKIDSTKKVTKKLAGYAAKTAVWANHETVSIFKWQTTVQDKLCYI